jgi:hypothetical protein
MLKHEKTLGKKVAVTPAVTDDDFGNMLAELRTSDLITITATSSSTTSSHGSSSTTSSDVPSAILKRGGSSDANPSSTQACVRGNMAQLQRWARREIRVSSGLPLLQSSSCVRQHAQARSDVLLGERSVCRRQSKKKLTTLPCMRQPVMVTWTWYTAW